MTRWTHNGQPVGQPQRPWRLTRAQRVEMEAALAGFRARIVASPRRVDRLRDVDSIEDAPLTPGWGQTVPVEPGCFVPSERATRIARARVAIALRAALRADEDARCEEALAYAQNEAADIVGRPAPATGHLLGACGFTALSALDTMREWPGLLWSEEPIPLALWEIEERRRRETVRVLEALLRWGLS